MSISWTRYWSDPKTGLYEQVATIYDDQDSADDGEWFSTAGFENVLVEVDESDTAGVTVGGSNDETIPANSSDGFTVVSEITSDGYTEIEKKDIPRWIKIHASTVSSGTVDVRVKVIGRGLGMADE